MKRKIFRLRPIDENSGPWDPGYNCAFGFVIRADSESAARALADANSGDEKRVRRDGGPPWLDPQLSSCVELTADGPAEMVMQDFRSS